MHNGLFNHALVRDYLCSQCHNGLIELHLNGASRIVCSRDHDHLGKVRKSTVEMLRSRSATEGIEVRMAYPELEPASELSVDRAMEELYGPARRES